MSAGVPAPPHQCEGDRAAGYHDPRELKVDVIESYVVLECLVAELKRKLIAGVAGVEQFGECRPIKHAGGDKTHRRRSAQGRMRNGDTEHR